MEKKYFNFLFSILFLTLFNLQTISPSIITGTPIRTGESINNYKHIETLKVGDEVLGLKLKKLDHEKFCIEFVKTPIQEIKKIKLNKLVFIETNVGQLCVGENKKFYNSKNNNWVDAKNLTLNDELLDINFNKTSLTKICIENLDEEIDSYELLLEEPHTFFICDSNGNPILVHNWVIAIPIITWTFGDGVAIIGFSTAAVVVGKQVLNGIIKYFAKENGADVSGFNPPSIFDEDIEQENEGKDKDKNPDKDKKGSELDELLKDTTPFKDKGKGTAEVFDKTGNSEQKNEDFKKIDFDKIEQKINKKGETITIGYLKNGDKIINRDFSTYDKRPTIEYQKNGSRNKVKIRYGDKNEI